MDERRKGHPPRLPGWDYAAHAPYFVTFQVSGRRRCLGRVGGARVHESSAGACVRAVWERLPGRFPGVVLDAMVIMPDHVHAILRLPGCCGALIHQGPRQPACPRQLQNKVTPALQRPGWQQPPNTLEDRASMHQDRALMNQGPTGVLAPMMADPGLLLGKVVRSWKAEAAFYIRRTGLADFAWQSRYYEHVIRTPAILDRVRVYIHRNPIRAAQS